MNPVLKNFLWDLWAPALALLAIADWRGGDLSGYWAWAICWLALCYTVESGLKTALREAVQPLVTTDQ